MCVRGERAARMDGGGRAVDRRGRWRRGGAQVYDGYVRGLQGPGVFTSV